MTAEEDGREQVAPEPPAATCPKCNAPRDPVACPRCGLTAERMAGWKSAAPEVPDALTQAWERAVEAWTDTARHDEILRLVTQHDAYAWAAAQYRRRPADDIRDRQLARVRKSTEASLLVAALASKKDRTPTPYRAHLIVLILFVVAAIAALIFTSILPKGTGDDSTPAQPGGR